MTNEQTSALERLITYLTPGKNHAVQLILCGGRCCQEKRRILEATIAEARADHAAVSAARQEAARG